ncbi:hypothetical protein SK128_017650 [Halocaridina rubra]|uniref:EF-hand domain-containing protein n=1 Tax=Halocaridina rubra TaxID=373956 RepID=A0AAN8WVU3_HALRR
MRDDERTYVVFTDQLEQIFHDFGVGLNDNETAEIFSGLDVEGTGTIPYELFMERLRPEMSPLRTTTLLEAYGTLIRSVDGLVDIETMRESYNPSCDERVASGEASEEEVLAEFIGRFETGVHMEGKVNRYEFFDYYSAVSASIDDDDEFLELIKNSWKF